MTLKLIVIVVTSLSCCGLLITDSLSARPVPQQTGRRFTVSKWGTLLELVDLDGKSLISKIDDGFKFNYHTQGKKRSASAIGTEAQRLLSSNEGPKANGNTAIAVVTTPDKALEITTRVTFDDKTGELLIWRTFRNISKHPVTLQMLRQHVDFRLVPGSEVNQAGAKSFDSSRLSAGLYKGEHDCDDGECPVPPPPTCPPSCPRPLPWYLQARLHLLQEHAVIGWSQPITLKPERYQEPGGKSYFVTKILVK